MEPQPPLAITGMETAKRIRRADHGCRIIFITTSPEFAVESYRYRAHHYLLKPVGAQQLFEILDGQKPHDINMDLIVTERR